MPQSKDLFDDTTMSFGEHLEVLRIHLWKAIIGLVICVIVSLAFGHYSIAVIRSPIDAALKRHGTEATDDVGKVNFWEGIKAWWSKKPEADPPDPPAPVVDPGTITIEVKSSDVARALHEFDPQNYPQSAESQTDKTISMKISSPHFAERNQIRDELNQIRDRQNRPVTLTVQEAFVTYLKVAFVTGFVMASPWVFYQVWLFVAAGLYPHERRYVHIYLPLSLTLFLGGMLFCFFGVFPFVLDFLLSFNKWLEIDPQIRLSEWISFAIMLPLMFGLSFQLPMVMLFMERISIFEAQDYREKRRMSILVIAVVSMFMTPADPMSMILMMLPLMLLYELGIFMCSFSSNKSPFEAKAD